MKLGSLVALSKPLSAWMREPSPHGWVYGVFAQGNQ
ncbi:MAG: hypothetical protein ACI9J0_004209, partial [Cryomorphaceae bacterium]